MSVNIFHNLSNYTKGFHSASQAGGAVRRCRTVFCKLLVAMEGLDSRADIRDRKARCGCRHEANDRVGVRGRRWRDPASAQRIPGSFQIFRGAGAGIRSSRWRRHLSHPPRSLAEQERGTFWPTTSRYPERKMQLALNQARAAFPDLPPAPFISCQRFRLALTLRCAAARRLRSAPRPGRRKRGISAVASRRHRRLR
jgi:hypothetical protein